MENSPLCYAENIMPTLKEFAAQLKSQGAQLDGDVWRISLDDGVAEVRVTRLDAYITALKAAKIKTERSGGAWRWSAAGLEGDVSLDPEGCWLNLPPLGARLRALDADRQPVNAPLRLLAQLADLLPRARDPFAVDALAALVERLGGRVAGELLRPLSESRASGGGALVFQGDTRGFTSEATSEGGTLRLRLRLEQATGRAGADLPNGELGAELGKDGWSLSWNGVLAARNTVRAARAAAPSAP